MLRYAFSSYREELHEIESSYATVLTNIRQNVRDDAYRLVFVGRVSGGSGAFFSPRWFAPPAAKRVLSES